MRYIFSIFIAVLLINTQLESNSLNRATDKEAIDKLLKKADGDPNSVKIYMSIARHYLKMGKKKEALKMYQKVISIDPKHIDAYLYLSLYYARAREYKKSKELIKKALLIEPNNLTVKRTLHYIYYVSAEYNSSIELAKELLETDIISKDFLHNSIAQSNIRLDRYDIALKEIKRAINLNPNEFYHYIILGVIFDKLHQDKFAYISYKKAISLYKKDPKEIYLNILINMQIFEVKLNNKILKEFLELSRNSKIYLVNYKVINIIQKVIDNNSVDFKKLIKSHNINGIKKFGFDDYFIWIDSMEKSQKRDTLERLIEQLKSLELEEFEKYI